MPRSWAIAGRSPRADRRPLAPMARPRPAAGSIAGLGRVAGAIFLVSAVLLRWPARLPAWGDQAVMALGSVLVGCAVLLAAAWLVPRPGG